MKLSTLIISPKTNLDLMHLAANVYGKMPVISIFSLTQTRITVKMKEQIQDLNTKLKIAELSLVGYNADTGLDLSISND